MRPCPRWPGPAIASSNGRGLDNDGDTAYDGADSDCTPVPVEKPTWSFIKALYGE